MKWAVKHELKGSAMPERLIKSTIHAGENSKQSSILIINGGSSSIKFTLYETGKPLRRLLNGKVDGYLRMLMVPVLAIASCRVLRSQ